jgi:hypothetical protein
VPLKQGPTPEQIRAGLREDTAGIVAAPAESVGKDWQRDESVAPAAVVTQSGPPSTEQRNRILELAGNIGRGDARIIAQAALGREVSALIVKDIHTAHDAVKVIAALQGAWNDIQVERKQTRSAS